MMSVSASQNTAAGARTAIWKVGTVRKQSNFGGWIAFVQSDDVTDINVARCVADTNREAKEKARRIVDEHNNCADLIAALKEIETICTESAGDCRRRMGARVGNVLVAARAAIAKTGGAK